MPSRTAKTLDVLFVIALDEERDDVIELLPSTPQPAKYGEHKISAFTIQLTSQASLNCGLWLVGDMGPEAVLMDLGELVRETEPAMVINLGIAGMLSGDARIGDCVFAEALFYYSHRGAIAAGDSIDEMFLTGGKSFSTPSKALERFKSEYKNSPTIKKSFQDFSSRFSHTHGFHAGDSSVQGQALHNLVRQQQSVLFGEIASGTFVGKSSEFKALLLKKNRNFLALDMESAGVAMVMGKKFRSTQLVIIKGISDPSDEHKKAVETVTGGKNRKWAARNAMQAALLMLKHADLRLETAGETLRPVVTPISIEQLTGQYSMPRSYRALLQKRDTVSAETLLSLSKAFRLHPCNDNQAPLAALEAALAATSPKSAIALTGSAGTGKTSLLCLLYVYLWKRRADDPSRPEPLLISLSPSLGFFDEEYFEASLDSKMEQIEQYFKSVENQEQDESQHYILLLDSADADREAEARLKSVVTSFCDRRPHTVLIGGRSEKTKFGMTTGKRFHLTAHNRRDADLNELTAAFLNLAGRHTDESHRWLRKLAYESPHDEIDFFDLGIALQLFDSTSNTSTGDGPTIAYLEFGRLRLKQMGVPEDRIDSEILEAAHAAVRFKGENFPDDEKATISQAVRALLNAHPRFRDFLIAYAVVHDLSAWRQGSELPESLKRVYPSRISTFCKDLLRRTGFEEVCCSNALHLLGGGLCSRKTEAMLIYLLGRLKDRQQCGRARQYLKTRLDDARKIQENTLDIAEAEQRESLLYARTVYITLAYLGDHSVLLEYVDQLITRSHLDRINRGFHLEYYGDLDFNFDQPLQNDDPLEECPQTTERLAARIARSKRSPLFELEVQTFLSLAVQRHLEGQLPERFMELAKEVLHDRTIRESITNAELREYMRMVSGCLELEDCRLARICSLYHVIKSTPRTGWEKRGVGNCETVASHTYGAWLLGLFMLPSRSEARGYSKAKILEMLLLHDLAEAIKGDIPQEIKGTRETEAELAELRKLKYYGFVTGNEELQGIVDAVQDFEHDNGTNAAVARDIDRLEILMQIYTFKRAGKKLTEGDDWERQIRDEIGTTIGQAILKKLQILNPLGGSNGSEVEDES